MRCQEGYSLKEGDKLTQEIQGCMLHGSALLCHWVRWRGVIIRQKVQQLRLCLMGGGR